MTFYFYDLETSGINPRAQRIMQFAGQRTDENFNPIGDPQNWLVRLTDEILPDPDAIVLTGITPQKTLEEGYSEAEFLALLTEQVLQPDTIILGFNTIRFDDEFMRATLWRNFYDPYEWQWQDGRSRWDLLDVVRMVRALRPEGIKWPTENYKGKKVATNRLELLTKANGLDHENAHDALNDVYATIAIARLLKEKQPKMFDYLLGMRDKNKVKQLVQGDDPQPFLYCSGRYSTQWDKTTAVVAVGETDNGGFLVYDLRQDPTELASLDDEELIQKAFSRNEETEILAVKCMKVNCCPAVAPLGVLDDSSQKRLGLTQQMIERNFNALRKLPGFTERISALYEKDQLDRKAKYKSQTDPDYQMYDGFVGDSDKTKMRAVRAADVNSLADLTLDFSDERLEKILLRYKARNYPKSLNESERENWEAYRSERVIRGMPGQLSLEQFAKRISELSVTRSSDEQAQFLLEELQLYAESIAPVPEEQ